MKAFFLKLFAWVTGLTTSVWEAIEPVLRSESGKLLQLVLPIAIGVVYSLASKDESGEEKRNAAIAMISGELVRRGISVGNHIVNLAIEIAVGKLKCAQTKEALGAAERFTGHS